METQVAIEKSATEKKTTPTRQHRLMKGKKDVLIGTLNFRTLQNQEQNSELIAAAQETDHDIICIQEHRFIHEDLL